MTKSSTPKRSRQPDLVLGALPVAVINRTIETELEPGDVILSRAAQRHAARRHPEDYPVCLPHLAAIVAAPLYVGDDHRNPGKIEVIGRVMAVGGFVLVAIDVTRDADGRYGIASFYRIREDQVQGRRERGFLRVAVHHPQMHERPRLLGAFRS